MTNLRRLLEKDVPFMIEWMRDEDIQQRFQKDMKSITEEQALAFCRSSEIPEKLTENISIHFAIVDEKDDYLGTISLKNISLLNRTAEYAISTRKCVHGKGVSKEATRLLLEKAFDEYGLHKVYLNVLKDNIRAIHFYEKCGFVYEGEFREHIMKNGEYKTLVWYGMLKKEFDKKLRKM